MAAVRAVPLSTESTGSPRDGREPQPRGLHAPGALYWRRPGPGDPPGWREGLREPTGAASESA